MRQHDFVTFSRDSSSLTADVIAIGGTILAAILIGAMILVPYPLRMEAKGQLLQNRSRCVHQPEGTDESFELLAYKTGLQDPSDWLAPPDDMTMVALIGSSINAEDQLGIPKLKPPRSR